MVKVAYLSILILNYFWQKKTLILLHAKCKAYASYLLDFLPLPSVFPLKEAMVNTLHQVSTFNGHHAHILAFSIRMQHTKKEASATGTLNRKKIGSSNL
jgi:hypothetical protein